MSTCKDCIYYDLCADFNLTTRSCYKRSMQIVKDDGKPERCGFYKDRSKFVELPCKVGDVFYGIDTYGINAYSCYGVGYGYVGDNKLGFILFTVGRREYIFGKEAFLTEAEAEQAIKEQEKE